MIKNKEKAKKDLGRRKHHNEEINKIEGFTGRSAEKGKRKRQRK